MKTIIDIGDTVICDQCNADHTNSGEIGGFVFSGHGYCPQCTEKGMESIKKYGEEQYIEAIALPGETFKHFILRIRNGNNQITIETK